MCRPFPWLFDSRSCHQACVLHACKRSGLSVSLYKIVGQKRSPEEVSKRAKANGYRYRTYYEEDGKRVNAIPAPKTIRDQGYILKR